MKICYVITQGCEIGGAQIHVRDLSVYFNDKNRVCVIVGEEGLLSEQLRERGVKCYIVPDLRREVNLYKDIRAIIKIRKLILQEEFDLISLHSTKAGVVGRIAAFSLPSKVIFTAHGWSFANGISPFKQKVYSFVERLLAPLANKIITVSSQDKELALQKKVSNYNQQVVIHNGMPQLEKTVVFSDATDICQLVMIARFSEQKDHETLFAALSNINDLNWHLELVGKGRLMSHFKKRAEDLGIADRVTFSGQRSDVDMLLCKKDIFLLISKWEGFPRSILEAMRARLPVIASNVGGVSESVVDNYSGFLVERGDQVTLEIKLRALMANKDLRQQFGSIGYASYIDNFTFESMVRKTELVYSEVLCKQPNCVDLAE
ncbi:glycosyltransferase family 4 protein [Vibrio vulnificus]|uniref:glycosyltransferase family 4 protein n=1 Tax=Vibrio vulnificus TaxID=672 RepID=UPI0032ED015B